MHSQADPSTPVETVDPHAEKSKLEAQHAGGAKWFYWIAALSVVNSIVIHVGGEWSFVIGLGITQLIDAVAAGLGQEMGSSAATLLTVFAIAGDLMVAGLFVLFGFFALRRQAWAFWVGMALYGLDGLLFLLVGDWLSIGFHVFALFGLVGGLTAAQKLGNLEGAAGVSPQVDCKPITP